MTTIGLTLEPLDVLFFRDGRPFGAATSGASALPLPQTLAGAIWTGLLETHGCDFARLQSALRERGDLAAAIASAGGPPWIAALGVRGPWLARRPASGELEVLVPAPAVLHADKSRHATAERRLHALRPLPPGRLPGWRPPESAPGLWPLWLRHPQPTQPATGYLTPAGLQAFLAAKPVPANQLVGAEQLFDYDRRTGIGIDPDRLSAEESRIYGATFLALKPEVSLYAEVVLPREVDRSAFPCIETLAFGGEGRRVRVHSLERPFPWPEQAPARRGEKPLVLLITPGLFRESWKPAALNGRLVAAAVPGSVAVSGWDLARGGPKPNRFAAQAGSVYFLDQFPNNDLTLLPDSLADRPDDQAQGWGCYLKGVWIDE